MDPKHSNRMTFPVGEGRYQCDARHRVQSAENGRNRCSTRGSSHDDSVCAYERAARSKTILGIRCTQRHLDDPLGNGSEFALVAEADSPPGSGMRAHILKGFSRGLPIVTTSIGLEGILAKEGKEVLIADEPEAFASAVVRIIRDPELQDRLSINARKLATSRYDWRVALSPLERLYPGMIGHEGHYGRK